jgi:hypothetical protein
MTQTGWATFWAIFSQAHLVTLTSSADSVSESNRQNTTFVGADQGDQMSLQKSRPKCSPTKFFVKKNNTKLVPWKKSSRNM